MKYLELSNAKYYNLNDFEKRLLETPNTEIKFEDTILTPFYINDLGILELYDYELNIRVVDNSNFEHFILTKTGKETILEVNSKIVDKLKSCYIEVLKPQSNVSIDALVAYIKFVKNSSEIHVRIKNVFNELDSEKLFFEVY